MTLVFLLAMITSSIYTIKATNVPGLSLMNSYGSTIDCWNPFLTNEFVKVKIHCLLACFNPYFDFFSLQIGFGRLLVTPWGNSMYVYWSNWPWKNALLMSSCSRNHPFFADKANKNFIIAIFATGEKFPGNLCYFVVRSLWQLALPCISIWFSFIFEHPFTSYWIFVSR